jgi:hypothetical protein
MAMTVRLPRDFGRLWAGDRYGRQEAVLDPRFLSGGYRARICSEKVVIPDKPGEGRAQIRDSRNR